MSAAENAFPTSPLVHLHRRSFALPILEFQWQEMNDCWERVTRMQKRGLVPLLAWSEMLPFFFFFSFPRFLTLGNSIILSSTFGETLVHDCLPALVTVSLPSSFSHLQFLYFSPNALIWQHWCYNQWFLWDPVPQFKFLFPVAFLYFPRIVIYWFCVSSSSEALHSGSTFLKLSRFKIYTHVCYMSQNL